MQFLLIENNGKSLCLVCQETTAVFKEHNLKRHYQSQHKAEYKTMVG